MKVTHLMAKITISAGILLILSATGFTQKIRYNYAPGTDFSKYKTYKWVKIEGAQYPSQLIDEQIKRSIDAQLGSKGLSKTDSNPDLVVTYQAAVNQERQWNAYSTGDGYGGDGGWRGWGGMGMGGMSTTTATSTTINIGSLNLDLYDV